MAALRPASVRSDIQAPPRMCAPASEPRMTVVPFSTFLAPRAQIQGLGAASPHPRSRFNSRLRGRQRQSRSAWRRAQAVAQEFDLDGVAIAEDYYSILGLTPDATQEEIKGAYYSCMKACHPDLSNNHPDSVAFCTFVNEVYEVLSDSEMRAVYDDIKGYSATAMNPFLDSLDRDHVFVDEFTCIGCKNCANTAERTFGIEDLWGRARVFHQHGDPGPKIQEAIDTCPVTCIHWVSAPQLALLEDEMRRMERVSVGVMMAGQGAKGADVFGQASNRWEKRKLRAQEKARTRAAREKHKTRKWGSPFWGSAEPQMSEERNSNEDKKSEARGGQWDDRVRKEKMQKAAAAARRWREYSRQGVDRKRMLALAEQASREQHQEGEQQQEQQPEQEASVR